MGVLFCKLSSSAQPLHSFPSHSHPPTFSSHTTPSREQQTTSTSSQDIATTHSEDHSSADPPLGPHSYLCHPFHQRLMDPNRHLHCFPPRALRPEQLCPRPVQAD